jgi:hypothetical protein
MVYQRLIKLSRPGKRMLFVAISILAATISIRADGGFVLWQRTAGSFTVTAFATESPLRTGPADISFLVENTSEGSPGIVDARVFIVLENVTSPTVRAEATHTEARNKLLYCSRLNLPKAGQWTMRVNVTDGSESFEFINALAVTAPQSPLIAYWKLIAFPFAIMILFLINQGLRYEGRSTRRCVVRPSPS